MKKKKEREKDQWEVLGEVLSETLRLKYCTFIGVFKILSHFLSFKIMMFSSYQFTYVINIEVRRGKRITK